MGGINEDVCSNNIREWMESLGLREVLLDKVGGENAPSTFDKGSRSIDSIMCSANIEISKTDYMPFGEGAGDHISLVIDINKRSVFGNPYAPSSTLRVRKLKLKDPRIIKNISNRWIDFTRKTKYSNNFMISINPQYNILCNHKYLCSYRFNSSRGYALCWKKVPQIPCW